MRSSIRLFALALPLSWISAASAGTPVQASGQFIKFRDEAALNIYGLTPSRRAHSQISSLD